MRRRGTIPFLSVLAFVVATLALALAHRQHGMDHPPIPRAFPHGPHGSYDCALCHHDFGQDRFASWPEHHCVACHQVTPALSAGTEATFHQFCESCHIRLREEGARAGPVKACSGCHAARGPPGRGTFILN